MSTEKNFIFDKRPAQFLTEFYFGSIPKIRLHISHNDLDGYSCFIPTKIASNIVKNESHYDEDYYDVISSIPIPKYLTGELKTFFDCYDDDMISKELWILITDLGGIDPFDLYPTLLSLRETHCRKDTKIHVCILDHHINSVLDNIMAESKSAFKLCSDKENGITRFYMSNENITIDYYDKIGESASKILTDVFTDIDFVRNQIPFRSIVLLKRFINYVSLWDNGNFGFWNSRYIHKVDKQVKYNLVFSYFAQLDHFSHAIGDGDDCMRNLFVSQLADYFTYSNCSSSFIDVYDEIAQSRLIKMNDDYEKFINILSYSFNLVKAVDNGSITFDLKWLEDQSITIKIPKDTIVEYNDKLKNMFIDVFQDTDEFNKYAYSPYAKRYLKTHNTAITIRINRHSNGDISADLRCLMDNISVQRIAFENGGGGHKKAAGFPIDLEFNKEENQK